MTDEIEKLREECHEAADQYATAYAWWARWRDHVPGRNKHHASAVRESNAASARLHEAIDRLAKKCTEFQSRAELTEGKLTDERVVSVLRSTPGWGALNAQELAAVIVRGVEKS